MNKTFLKSILRANVGQTAAHPDLLPSKLVHLSVKVSGEAVFANTAILGNANTLVESSLRHRLQNHDLSCSVEADQVFISAKKIQEQCKTLLYPYPFNTDDKVPETLSNFYTSGFHAWSSRAMRAVSA